MFLTDLAVNGKVFDSTQNQALFALLFLYRDVLKINLPCIEALTRVQLQNKSLVKNPFDV